MLNPRDDLFNDPYLRAVRRAAHPKPEDIERADDKRPDPLDVRRSAAEVWGLSVDELLMPCRGREYVYPRFAASLALSAICRLSNGRIAELTGGKDVSTALHAVRKARQLRSQNADFSEKLTRLFAIYGRKI